MIRACLLLGVEPRECFMDQGSRLEHFNPLAQPFTRSLIPVTCVLKTAMSGGAST
jgi:hypothetical protein